jgi:DNA-directed RNA polymerase specialized sigma subunit
MEGYRVREIGMKLGVSHVRIIKIQKNIRRKLNADYLPIYAELHQ